MEIRYSINELATKAVPMRVNCMLNIALPCACNVCSFKPLLSVKAAFGLYVDLPAREAGGEAGVLTLVANRQ